MAVERAQLEFELRAQPIRAGAEQMVIAAGITGSRAGNYRAVVTGILNVARSTAPGTEERRQKLEAVIRVSLRPGQDESLVRRLADYALAEWDRQQEPDAEPG